MIELRKLQQSRVQQRKTSKEHFLSDNRLTDYNSNPSNVANQQELRP